MTPLAPLRMLLLGTVGWLILGVGLYYSYIAYDAWSTVPPESTGKPAATGMDVEENQQPATSDADADRASLVSPPRTVITRRQNEVPWTEITIAAVCLLWSVCGRMPVKAIFSIGSKGTGQKQDAKSSPSSTSVIERPCGSRLYIETHGRATGPTLVLTHGWSLDSAAWKYMLPLLAARYRVVVWDLAGLGKSAAPRTQDYTLEKMAGDLESVIVESSRDRAVILVGHSIGGMIQQTFCRTHPDTLAKAVKGIVFVHTTYTNPLATNVIAGIARPLQPLIKLINDAMIPLEALFWLSNWQSYWNGSLHMAARFESFSGKQTWEQLDFSAWKGAVARPSVVARGNDGMLKFDEKNTLPHVQLPSLVISGLNDRLTLRSASRHIEELLPNNESLDDGGGHLGHIESTQKTAQAILSFADKAFARRIEAS